MRKRSRQQYRMKERQSRNEFEICKAKRGHRAKEFLTDMAAVGHYVATCYTSEDAVEVLREYCELLSPQWMKEPNNSVWKEGTISPLKKK